MKNILILVFVLASVSGFSQSKEVLGIDNDPYLTAAESKFLTEYLDSAQLNSVSLKNKKAIFVTGNSGSQLGSKSKYFEQIRLWERDGKKIATTAIALSSDEKAVSGGYDVILTYWVKVLPEKSKKKILRILKSQQPRMQE